MNTQPVRPSFAVLRPLLLSEETRVNKAPKPLSQDSAMLLYSTTSNKQSAGSFPNYSQGNNKFRGKFSKNKSYPPGSYGHRYNVAAKPPADKSTGSLGSSPLVRPPMKASQKCQICGLYNHEALDCIDRFNHAYASNKLHKSLVAMHIDGSSNIVWYPDSGASAHMTCDISLLHFLVPYTGTTKVMIGNGELLPISHIGTASIASLILSDVFLVPALTKNLISIQKLCLDNSCIVQFSHNTFSVKDSQIMITLLQSSNSGSLYPIKTAAVLALATQSATTSSS
ncbi:hypothetical protein LIER_28627 [Lithospermum erythrorhizon]|uniref:Retrovirus-related Pol polyprotein from transposon TNT 1-94-like beta-barrel domain-containing protein n=1 Tax=Lithospermum erythrorhizon TaxID=34254 RepID=A0AAV3RK29_LITER